MKKRCVWLCILMALLLLTACGQTPEPLGSSMPSGDDTAQSTTTSADAAKEDGTTTTTEGTLPTGETTGQTTKSPTYDAQTTTKTTTEKVNTVTTKANKTESYMEYTEYNLDTYMKPMWQGNVMYNEIVMFFPNGQTKKVDPAPLLYKPKKVVSVRSYDLKTEYVEGVDYTVENGCIALTANSRIKAWAYDDYYLKQPGEKPAGGLPCISVPGRYFVFGDGALFAKYQVCVTYTYDGKWDGPVPAYQGHKLPKTSMKLAKKQTLNVVYYGDSVTVGKEASGVNKIAPKMPRWSDMVTEYLEEKTGAKINATNTAKGGQTTQWGLENVEKNVNAYNPDLVVLAFGMNDGSRQYSTGVYKANTETIIKKVRAKHPNCEFLLVATHLPNPDESSRQGPQAEYAACLKELADSMSGVAVANVTETHQYLLTKKRYGDMTANNVNHPNDWLIRVQGQVIAQALWPDIG